MPEHILNSKNYERKRLRYIKYSRSFFMQKSGDSYGII